MAEENFILVSLKETEAKKLAQVISNDTSRNILDYLATVKDATETDISTKLSLPISTVHYNLQALVKARLVQAQEFHYSAKGKEVNHYSLANKYVIIAPKNAPETLRDKLRKILPVALLGVGAAGIIHLFRERFRMFGGQKLAEQIVAPGLMSIDAGIYGEQATGIAADEAVRSSAGPLAASMPGADADIAQESMRIMKDTADGAAGSAADSVTDLGQNISENISEIMPPDFPQMVSQNMDNITEAVTDTLPGAADLIRDGFQPEYQIADSFYQAQSVVSQNLALWFLYGVIFAILVFLIVDWVSRKRER